jgi:neural Wiskott-Aldrich syndrome protein
MPDASEAATGQLIENIPRSMRVAIPVTVEVRLVRGDDGVAGETPAQYHAMLASRAMTVRLAAPGGGYTIETLSAETQWIEGALPATGQALARWRWLVTPQRHGRGRLQLAVSARWIGPDGISAEMPLPVQLVTVEVRRNFAKGAIGLLGWLGAAAIGAAVALFGGGVGEALLKLIRG